MSTHKSESVIILSMADLMTVYRTKTVTESFREIGASVSDPFVFVVEEVHRPGIRLQIFLQRLPSSLFLLRKLVTRVVGELDQEERIDVRSLLRIRLL